MAKERESSKIVAAIAAYWRYVRQYPVISIETKAKLKNARYGDRADVLVLNKDRILTEIEVKTSVKDLENDERKKIHKDFGNRVNQYPVHYFYFGVPQNIEREATIIIKDSYPHAGLIVVDKHIKLTEPEIRIVIEPRRFYKPPLNPAEVNFILKAMSSAVCRMTFKKANPKKSKSNSKTDDGRKKEEESESELESELNEELRQLESEQQ
jgi:site-specific DNA-cytosine methylase